MEPTTKRSSSSPWLNGLLSLLVPGLGQMVRGERWRGIGLFVTTAALGGLILWGGQFLLFVPLAGVWLWGAWDALRDEEGRPPRTTVPFLLAAFIVYALGVQSTEINPQRLATRLPRIAPVVRALVNPELFAYPTEDRIGYTPIQVPCIEPLPEPEGTATVSPTLSVKDPCAAMGETIVVEGEGFFPDFEGEMWWRNPIGDQQPVIKDDVHLRFLTDGNGRFQISLEVPRTAVPLDRRPEEGETQTHRVEARQFKPYGSLQPTDTLNLVVEKIGETIALGFIATVMAVVFALPISFLAARNLMWGNPITRGTYYVVRTILNVVRSIETLIWAIVFTVWVGQGAFAGTLALFLHSVAALGKLYSEAIEGIDPGPIEAVRSTGANWAQVVVYAVLPQFMPSFLGFTLLRWDINVRMSTVIGLVCDAGLGFLIIQWINLSKFSAMATAIIAIVIVVATLDYVSAALRQRVIGGETAVRRRGRLRQYLGSAIDRIRRPNPVFRWVWRYLPVILSLAAFGAMLWWSWGIAGINLAKFVGDAPKGLRMARAFLVPDVVTVPTEEITQTAALPVPCGSVEVEPPPSSGPRVEIVPSCGAPGDVVTIKGHELPANTSVSVRWVLPTGGGFPIEPIETLEEGCCKTDDQGSFSVSAKIRQSLMYLPKEGHPGPGQVEVAWKQAIGGPQPSEALITVLNLALVTLLMALLATTFGSLIAIPLSFFAARNIVGRGPIGQGIYYLFRTLFNLTRSIEPLIFAVICAFWVGWGPFAGVLALGFWNIPNLAKLFSEAIEEIDPGPVEAVTSTGANRLQTLLFAVVPQLIPRFLAYILYYWDINIRMSTVIGFVGGGGIGHQFKVWVGRDLYEAAGTATWAIVIMVWSMDYISAKVRERLT